MPWVRWGPQGPLDLRDLVGSRVLQGLKEPWDLVVPKGWRGPWVCKDPLDNRGPEEKSERQAALGRKETRGIQVIAVQQVSRDPAGLRERQVPWAPSVCRAFGARKGRPAPPARWDNKVLEESKANLAREDFKDWRAHVVRRARRGPPARLEREDRKVPKETKATWV